MRKLLLPIGCLMATLIGGCGGGGGSTSASSVTPTGAQNVAPISVDPGPAAVANTAFVSVTICSPATTNCQSIDHIEVDTGSTGLRIMSSALSSGISLPQAFTASNEPLVECTQFVDGFSWGPMKAADVAIGGEKINNLPVQIIGDAAFSTMVPAGCSSTGPAENTVQAFGANGILGVGVFRQDCGPACVTTAFDGNYYACPSSGCVPTTVALVQQAQNPVWLFASDNNGVILELPAINAGGASGASGSLVFGIGTESNNSLGTATVLTVDPSNGNVTTLFEGQTISDSFVDSGSNGLFLADGSTTVCTSTAASGFYCPAATQNLSAMMQSATGVVANVSFAVANADNLVANGSLFAFNDLAGPSSPVQSFDWGLPFFYGRNVYVAIEGQTTAAGHGPFIAF